MKTIAYAISLLLVVVIVCSATGGWQIAVSGSTWDRRVVVSDGMISYLSLQHPVSPQSVRWAFGRMEKIDWYAPQKTRTVSRESFDGRGLSIRIVSVSGYLPALAMIVLASVIFYRRQTAGTKSLVNGFEVKI